MVEWDGNTCVLALEGERDRERKSGGGERKRWNGSRNEQKRVKETAKETHFPWRQIPARKVS